MGLAVLIWLHMLGETEILAAKALSSPLAGRPQATDCARNCWCSVFAFSLLVNVMLTTVRKCNVEKKDCRKY